MELINVKDFDFKGRKGEEIWCVEEVENNAEERSIDVYECENEKEAIEKCEEKNKYNQDKRVKFIVIRYLVEEDGLTAC